MTAEKEQCRICGGDETVNLINSFGLQPVAEYMDECLPEAPATSHSAEAIRVCRVPDVSVPTGNF